MKRVWELIITNWQSASIAMLAVAIIASLYMFRIGGLVPVSPGEVVARNSSVSIKVILDNPINAPYKIKHLITGQVSKSVATERLVGAGFAIFSVGLFYLMARRFSSKRAAILGVALYASSSTLLNNGRLATPNVMLLMLFVLAICWYELRFSSHIARTWLLTTFVVSIAIYTPGMLYYILVGLGLQARHVKKQKVVPKPLILGICAGVGLLILAPLIVGFIQNPTIWREYFAVPAVLPNILTLLKNLLAVPFGLFVQAPLNPIYRLGRQPTLDVFAAVLFILGVVVLIKQHKLSRLYLFGGVLALGSVVTVLSGNYENSFMLLPFVYLIVTMGLDYLLDAWRAVFPHNPLARSLSVGVIALAVLISCNFQTKRYFVAWPHNPAAQAAFVQK